MKKIYVSLLLIELIISTSVKAQDPHFTQFYANPLYLNPAFAGSAICQRIILNHRTEWPGIAGTYVSTSASFDRFVPGIKSGIGILAMNDRAGEGTLKTNSIGLVYAKQFAINRTVSINAGARATYGQKTIDWDKLTFGDMINPQRGFVYNTNETRGLNKKSYADFSAGILVVSKRYYAGFAADHLTEPDEGFKDGSKLPLKYTAHAGALIPIDKGKETSVSPNILYQKQQDFEQLNFGVYFTKGPLVGGFWYRQAHKNPDSFILLLGVQHGMLKFGYSYDITVSRLSNVSAGSHEISCGLQFECKKTTKKIRPDICPSF